MATNRVREDGGHLSVVVTNPTTPASGDPIRFGLLTGVALTDEGEGGNGATTTSVDFSLAVYDLSVKGVDDNGNSAVAAGDAIFYVDADTPKLSKKASGYFFGFALEAVQSAATTTINVQHVPSPGSGSLTSGGVNTTQLADGAVTAAKLSTNLMLGYIPIPLTSWRILATNDTVASGAGDGGVVSNDTDPTLKRVNGATDKKLRIAWAATSVVEIAADIAYPPDLDDTAAIVVHILCGVGGAMDTPVLGVSYFENVGDANAGGNTAALAATVADKTVTIAAGNVGTYPGGASLGIVPAAHGNDAIYIYSTWAVYTRKS